MNAELNRLATFRDWPECYTICSPISLARLGFYFSGFDASANHQQQQQQHAAVTCFACSTSFSRWTSLKCLKSKHRRRSPHCPRSHLNAVVELPAAESQHRRPPSPTLAIDGQPQATAAVMTIGRDAVSVDPQLAVILNRLSGRDAANARKSSSAGAQLRCETVRLQTFKGWKKSNIVSPSDLARSGFYYSGSSDIVVCAFCAVRIHDWAVGDTPNEEHREKCPECPFVRLDFCRPVLAEISNNVRGAVGQKSLQELKEETRQLWNERLCPICYNKEFNCVTVPCGHLICDQCLLVIQQQGDHGAVTCPMCRRRVEGVETVTLLDILDENEDPVVNPMLDPT